MRRSARPLPSPCCAIVWSEQSGESLSAARGGIPSWYTATSKNRDRGGPFWDRPLPHHLACGSAPGGWNGSSRLYRQAPSFLQHGRRSAFLTARAAGISSPRVFTRAPSKWAAEAVVLRYRESSARHSFSPSVSPPTTASADSSMTACAGALSGSTSRSPQVRTHSFTARSPDLRHHPLVTRASWLLARSPWVAPPCIRFLSIDPQLRSTLPPHGRSPFRSCASLRSP